jgi:hypothetical protein
VELLLELERLVAGVGLAGALRRLGRVHASKRKDG